MRTMEVRTSTEKPYRYCRYGFGTVFPFQYQLGTNSVRFFRSSTDLVRFNVPVLSELSWNGRNCFFFQKFRKMRNSTENFLNENNMNHLSTCDRTELKKLPDQRTVYNLVRVGPNSRKIRGIHGMPYRSVFEDWGPGIPGPLN